MCGIVGVLKFNQDFDIHSVSSELVDLLTYCQNRGQDSAKIITQLRNPSDNIYFYNNDVNYTNLSNILEDKVLYSEKKGIGLVDKIFDEKNINDLYGDMGIGAVRYATTGKAGVLNNIQPMRYKNIVVCENGDINNFLEIKDFLKTKNYTFKTDSDVEAITKLFHYHFIKTNSGSLALKNCINGTNESPAMIGGYSVLALTQDSIVAGVDPNRIRQLGYSLLEDEIIFSSENSGVFKFVDSINSQNYSSKWVDLGPGDIIEVFRDGRVLKDNAKKISFSPCFFEWAYFSQESSIIDNKEVCTVRKKIGKLLAKEVKKNIFEAGFKSLENSIVVPVLSSGEWYALGFSNESGVPYLPVLFKNKYAFRTFIMDNQEARKRGVYLKHFPSMNIINGKDVILFDDSIVRGNTSQKIVDLFKYKAGANSVHFVSGVPPIKNKCYYGMDIKGNLPGKDKSISQIKELIGADTLTYGTIELWKQVLGDCCFGCLNNEYPTKIVREERFT